MILIPWGYTIFILIISPADATLCSFGASNLLSFLPAEVKVLLIFIKMVIISCITDDSPQNALLARHLRAIPRDTCRHEFQGGHRLFQFVNVHIIR
jgi:hypothetical protein